MTTFNAIAAVVTGLKYHPEPLSFPEPLIGATPVELAEARSQFQDIAAVANEYRKLTDQELVKLLPNASLRYGMSIFEPAYGKAKIIDADLFYAAVAKGIAQSEDVPGLLAALFPTHSVKTGGLPVLAEALDVEPKTLKRTLVDYDTPSSPLKVTPIKDAAKWQQKLEEGQISTVKASGAGD